MMDVCKQLCCIFIFVVVFTLGCGSAVATELALQADGGVMVEGLFYSSLSEFHESEYFRANGYRCGTRVLENESHARMKKSINDCTATLTAIQSEYWPAETYQLPVWFHVITDSGGQGYISNATINEQIEVLNQDYRAQSGTEGANGYDVKIQFVLAGITRTVNDSWYNDYDEYGYKSNLQRNPDKYVNIYTNTASGYLGYAYYPQDIDSGAVAKVYDGIVLYWETVGGRNNGYGNYNQGRTLVHEMGHYLGLLHTFDGGGCFNSYTAGDLIVDTNAQDISTATCSSRSTCPEEAPIHNYMDYSYDSCMSEFTREQANRSVCSLVNFRPEIYSIMSSTGDKAAVSPLLLPLLLKKSP